MVVVVVVVVDVLAGADCLLPVDLVTVEVAVVCSAVWTSSAVVSVGVIVVTTLSATPVTLS